MPTTILTEEQKNYVFMLLAAGDLPENEIRMFLARSGWQLDAIDAGVVYSRDSALIQKLNQFKAPKATAIPVTAPPIATSLYTTSIPQVTQADPYKEPLTMAASEFKQPVMQTQMGANTAVNTAAQIAQKQTVPEAISVISQVRTMPPAPKRSLMHAILVFVMWLLVLILTGLIVAILGYMYYAGTGLFENVPYIKLF
jgi:hypothetical protein